MNTNDSIGKRKATPNPKKPGLNPLLNLRNLPSQVSGLPDVLFTQYSVEIVITGRSTVTRKLRELTDSGEPGKYVDFEDALRLTKAAGFVKAQAKDEARSEGTELALNLFHQAKVDATVVRDPKAFTKTILGFAENLEKNAELVALAGDSIEDRAAKALFCGLHDKATTVANGYIEDHVAGGARTLKEVAADLHFPSSMIGKFLTGAISIAPGSKFWHGLYGKDMTKFAARSLGELAAMSGPQMATLFKDPALATQVREIASDVEIRRALGIVANGPIPVKLKEKYLEQEMPFPTPVRKVEMLRRHEASKSFPRLTNVETAQHPRVAKLYNEVLKSHFICPPLAVDEVKPFWEKLVRVPLMAPDLASRSYVAQAIELMEPESMDFPARPPWVRKIVTVNNVPVLNAVQPMGLQFEWGRATYAPIQIVGAKKKPNKKVLQRAANNRKTELTKYSRKIVNALKKRGIVEEVITAVADYLESFLYPKMQDLAAQIVWVTCEISVQSARKAVLNEEAGEADDPPNEDEKEDDEPEEGNDNDGDADDLPAPIWDLEI